jgi:hypothetical protein
MGPIMIIKHEELVESDFKGTVIDIETIGEFARHYSNSRQYKDHFMHSIADLSEAFSFIILAWRSILMGNLTKRNSSLKQKQSESWLLPTMMTHFLIMGIYV